VPVPRLVAWSDDGELVTIAHDEAQTRTVRKPDRVGNHGGWILMTRLPGCPINSMEGYESAAKANTGRNLADFVATWRREIPLQRLCGNLRFHDPISERPADLVLKSPASSIGHELDISGLLNVDGDVPFRIPSTPEYFRIRLEAEMHKLKTSSTYERNRTLLPLLDTFLLETLPKIDFMAPQDANDFVFTHYDLSPRNVLIVHDEAGPSRITGIVDFEFAGFFPPLEEFVNDEVHNSGDWDSEVYAEYLNRLEEHGIATPGKSINAEAWRRSRFMEKLISLVAPWWLPGEYQGEGLIEKLKEVETAVREMAQELSVCVAEDDVVKTKRTVG
jgi:hypothetical protein